MLINTIYGYFMFTENKNMSNFWWKIIALQILIATEICTTGLELDDNTKLTSENLHMLLIKKFLEVLIITQCNNT